MPLQLWKIFSAHDTAASAPVVLALAGDRRLRWCDSANARYFAGWAEPLCNLVGGIWYQYASRTTHCTNEVTMSGSLGVLQIRAAGNSSVFCGVKLSRKRF